MGSVEWHPTKPQPFRLRSSSRGETDKRSHRAEFDEFEQTQARKSTAGTAKSRLERFKESQRYGSIPKGTRPAQKKEKIRREPFALSSGRDESLILKRRAASRRESSTGSPDQHSHVYHASPTRLLDLAQPRHPLPSIKICQAKKAKAMKLVPLNKNAVF